MTAAPVVRWAIKSDEDYNPKMLNQDCNRKLFNWFLARVDVLTRLRIQ